VARPISADVTGLLAAWSQGDSRALEQLIPLVSEELRRLAHAYMRRQRPGHLLQTTALVHEAYIRLVDARSLNWQSRSHFYGISAKLMREILVDIARAEQAQKRGGGATPLPLDEAAGVAKTPGVDLVALDDALNDMARFDQRKASIVELRFFGGLSVEETADAVQVAPATVKREWNKAKAWLYHAIKVGPA
jgi:RNA polymerase sigma factor (TIGR02999 family)